MGCNRSASHCINQKGKSGLWEVSARAIVRLKWFFRGLEVAKAELAAKHWMRKQKGKTSLRIQSWEDAHSPSKWTAWLDKCIQKAHPPCRNWLPFSCSCYFCKVRGCKQSSRCEPLLSIIPRGTAGWCRRVTQPDRPFGLATIWHFTVLRRKPSQASALWQVRVALPYSSNAISNAGHPVFWSKKQYPKRVQSIAISRFFFFAHFKSDLDLQ